jgi:hypothetical protein
MLNCNNSPCFELSSASTGRDLGNPTWSSTRNMVADAQHANAYNDRMRALSSDSSDYHAYMSASDVPTFDHGQFTRSWVSCGFHVFV